jgi:REP-associated tyrosine transposase
MQCDWRDRLHAYLGGIVRDLGGFPEAVGGVEDHVHLLVGLRANQLLSEVVKEIKTSSSKWVHQELEKPLFSWQEGYGAFTVSPSQRKNVMEYIARQEEHHRRTTFQEEYLLFLKSCDVDYNEKYLW